jgi:hypothetical protein
MNRTKTNVTSLAARKKERLQQRGQETIDAVKRLFADIDAGVEMTPYELAKRAKDLSMPVPFLAPLAEAIRTRHLSDLPFGKLMALHLEGLDLEVLLDRE